MGGVSVIMDIIWGVESGLVLKTFPDDKGIDMSIETSTTNSNLFLIGSIDFNARFFYIPGRKFVHNHVGHASYTKLVFFLPTEITLVPDHMNSPLCCLIKDYMKR